MVQGNPGKASTSSPLLLDEVRCKYSWANGVARGPESSRTQYRKDLKKAFAEIDGLMAGFTYLDGMQSTHADAGASTAPTETPTPDYTACTQTTNPAHGYACEISNTDLLDDEEQPHNINASAESSNESTQPMPTQWAAIKNLREEMEYHHRRFVALQCVSQDTTLGQLREAFHDSMAVRRTGILIFRDILDGFSPSKLREVFTFASLSYSVAQLLYKEGRIEKRQILSGLRAWRDAIADQDEKKAFDKLARDLWPEAKDHLHFFPIQRGDPKDEVPMPLRPRNGVAITTMPRLQRADLPSDTSGGSLGNISMAWSFPDLDNPSHASLSCFDLAIDVTGAMHDAWNLSEVRPPNDLFPDRQQSSDISFIDAILGPSHLPDYAPPTLAPENPEMDTDYPVVTSPADSLEAGDVQLRNTFVFLVVLAFLAEIQDLLHILSGSGLLSKPEKLYKAQEEEQERFYQSVNERFVEKRGHQDRATYRRYNALLSVAKIFAREAYLRTLHGLKHYLVSIAVAVFPPGEQFQQFVLWVMQNGLSDAICSSPETPFQSRKEQSSQIRRIR